MTDAVARFDHREPGTPESAWLSALADVPPVAVPGPAARLVVLAAHPDDETLGCGGLMAAAAAAGASVRVVIATDGDASHPDSPTLTPRDLAAVRRREAEVAVGILAPGAELQLLGLPDGALAGHQDELRAALDAVLAEATHLLTPYADDGHPDHDVCGRVGAELATARRIRHWQYPVWLWQRTGPDDVAVPWRALRSVHLDASARAAKDAALAVYRSQHEPLSPAPGDEAILSPHMLAHFRRPAEYVVVAGADDAGNAAHFDDLYAGSGDPWGLGDRFYEHRKRALLLAALPRARFRRAFEPGCATGLLTRELARRCDAVVAWDVAEVAVDTARRAVGGQAGVELQVGAIPERWPAGAFDLVVLSEIGYYCADLDALRRRVEDCLTDDGVLVACHWRHPAPAHPHPAERVHDALGAGLRLVVDHREADFLLQVWTRTGESVAAAEGIVSAR